MIQFEVTDKLEMHFNDGDKPYLIETALTLEQKLPNT